MMFSNTNFYLLTIISSVFSSRKGFFLVRGREGEMWVHGHRGVTGGWERVISMN